VEKITARSGRQEHGTADRMTQIPGFLHAKQFLCKIPGEKKGNESKITIGMQ
jgi:hypothetical protein